MNPCIEVEQHQQDLQAIAQAIQALNQIEPGTPAMKMVFRGMARELAMQQFLSESAIQAINEGETGSRTWIEALSYFHSDGGCYPEEAA